jgi:hypothetical protein
MASTKGLSQINAVVLKCHTTDLNIIANQRDILVENCEAFMNLGLKPGILKIVKNKTAILTVEVPDDFIGDIPEGLALFEVKRKTGFFNKLLENTESKVLYVQHIKNETVPLTLSTLFMSLGISEENFFNVKLLANKYVELQKENSRLKNDTENKLPEIPEIPEMDELPPSTKPTYKALTGDIIRRSAHEKRFSLNASELSWLITDPITFEYISDPVVLNDNIYDYASITKWLRGSDIDPLNGTKLMEEVKLIPLCALRYILLCLEESSDGNLIYHSVPQDPLFASFVGQNFPLKPWEGIWKQYAFKFSGSSDCLSIMDQMYTLRRSAGKMVLEESLYEFCDMSKLEIGTKIKDGCKFINCLLPEWIQTNSSYVIENNIRHFHPIELLLVCNIEGQFIPDAELYLTHNGNIVEECYTREKKSNGYTSNTIEEIIHSCQPHNAVPFKIIQGKLVAYIKENCKIPRHNYPSIYHMHTLFDRRIRSKTNIGVTPPVQLIKLRMVELIALFAKDPSYQKAFDKLSQEVTQKTLTINNTYLQKRREALNIPFIADLTCYGHDLSFFSMQNRTISQIEFKHTYFVMTNLQNTKFVLCTFSQCWFVGANMRGTEFINCKFVECDDIFADAHVDTNTRVLTKVLDCSSESEQDSSFGNEESTSENSDFVQDDDVLVSSSEESAES